MKRLLLEIGVIIVFVGIILLLWNRNDRLRNDRDRNYQNVIALTSDISRYKTQDSLSVSQLKALNLKIEEYERIKVSDAKLIENLQIRNRDLKSVISAQAETILEMASPVRDTVIITSCGLDTLKSISYHSYWTDFEGYISKDSFRGTIINRDSLVIATTVQYKRFLGFLWKTKKIKNRQVDVVNRNPNTTIIGLEYVEIER